MKLLILGAAGGLGRQLLVQALDAGHDVTALVRDPARLATAPRLNVIRGDATDSQSLTSAVKSQTAILSALDVGKSLKGDVVSRATAALIPAMQVANVRRIIAVSAFGVGDTFRDASLMQKFFFTTLLRAIYADKARADAMLRNSALDWTLAYPVLLTNGPRTGSYRASESMPMRGMPKISRADVAEFMLAQLSSDRWMRRGAILAG